MDQIADNFITRKSKDNAFIVNKYICGDYLK